MERISIAAIRQALSDAERYTNPWTAFCPGPDEVLALVDAVEAAHERDGLIESMSEDWDALNLAFTRYRMAFARFDFDSP